MNKCLPPFIFVVTRNCRTENAPMTTTKFKRALRVSGCWTYFWLGFMAVSATFPAAAAQAQGLTPAWVELGEEGESDRANRRQ
jgi:hypothetical protein